MSKSKLKKRRTKVYSGEDAKASQPVVHRYSAVDRGKFGQFWYERKTIIKRVTLYGGGGTLFIFLLVEAIRSFF